MNKLLALLAVLLLCTHSWSACRPYSTYFSGQTNTGCSAITPNNVVCSSYTSCNSNGNDCRFYNSTSNLGCFSYNVVGYWSDCVSCDTEPEADSVKCTLNPNDPSCLVEKDTTLFACSDNVSGNGAIYRLHCKSINGVLSSCNGKQNVDVAADGQLIRQLTGSCAQNGFANGVFGGSDAAQDSTPPSANADCYAQIGSVCHMRDKASGNTFRCECDGSCAVALRNLMAGNANCTNPYPQPNDSLEIGGSSDSGDTPSSSEGTPSSPSSSESGGEGGTSSIYDPWSPLLEDIKANTQGTNNWLDQIHNNTETANGLLRDIVNKDWSPDIHVSSPNVNVQGDTNIINVEVQGDTAKAPKAILDFLSDSNFSVDTSDRAKWRGYADSITSDIGSFLDSMATEDTSWIKNSDSLSGAGQGVKTAFNAFKDSLGNSAFNDSLDGWMTKITDNGVISGDGSNSCPSVLTRQISFQFRMAGHTITTNAGTLGKYLCTPIEGLGVTLWAMARTLLRMIVAIACMFMLYRAVTGSDTSGSEDD